MNKLSDKVSVVQKDIALLERGKEVRYLGINLAIGDIFDAGRPRLRLSEADGICSCATSQAACVPLHSMHGLDYKEVHWVNTPERLHQHYGHASLWGIS